MAEQLYYARRSFTYGRPGSERPLDRGQMIQLEGLVNDEKLVRLGYVALAPKRATVVQCGTCGAEFMTDQGLGFHGRERHAKQQRTLTPKEEDKRTEERLKMEDDLAPLDLDKTAASRGYARTR